MAYENLDAWLEPLEGEACGDDLEYDPAFLELDQAAAGKPETQFAPAEAPQWPQVREFAEGLLGRTRDLRVGLLWGRAALNLDGLEALPAVLKLLNGWTMTCAGSIIVGCRLYHLNIHRILQESADV